jgi:DNA-binding NtrC family response regulator
MEITPMSLGVPARTALPSVLAIDSDERGRNTLQNMIRQSCRTVHAATLSVGLKALRRVPFAVVLCNDELQQGTSWHQVLHAIGSLPAAPLLIVTSRLADESLWAEALNLGAWDVLAKPFDEQEVTRVVSSACYQWRTRNALPQPARINQTLAAPRLSTASVCA